MLYDYTDPLSYWLVIEVIPDSDGEPPTSPERILRTRRSSWHGVTQSVIDACTYHHQSGNRCLVVSSHWADGRYGYVGRHESVRWIIENGEVLELDGSGVPAARGTTEAWRNAL